jgi:Peptidase U49
MSHPDDAALPADPEEIDRLIDAAAPEKAQAWRDLRSRYQLSFHPIADCRGATLRARGRRIEFDHKTMTWLWLLGFGGWRAFRLHGPHLLWRAMTGVAINAQLRADDPTFREAEGEYEAVLYALRDFPELETVDGEEFWPHAIPRPQVDKTGLDFEQQAAFDLTMTTTAYMLLHEVRHVMYTAEGGRPSAPYEEIKCDSFARHFLLDGVSDYAAQTNQRAEDVMAKRAAGIALGAYVLYQVTPESGRGGSADYPPVADRLEVLFQEVAPAPPRWFWDFATSLLVALVVKRDRTSEIPSPKVVNSAWPSSSRFEPDMELEERPLLIPPNLAD